VSQIVISEPDIEAAIAHLRELPHSATASMPVEWSPKRFLDTLTATLRANPRARARCLSRLACGRLYSALLWIWSVQTLARMQTGRYGFSFGRLGSTRLGSKPLTFDPRKSGLAACHGKELGARAPRSAGIRMHKRGF
jgi:hypothetical protein